jgi:integrase
MLAELAFDQVMLMFLQHSQANKRSYAADLSRARALSRHFRGRNVYGLAGADVDGYIHARQADGVSAGGINRELMLLSNSERLIQCADSPALADFIRLALHTGCRSGELLALEWARVDFQQNLLRLYPQHTKTARRRSVPLNTQALAALQSRLAWRNQHCPGHAHVFLNARCGCRQTFLKAFHAACKQVGIEDFRIHDLRHTCAAWLVNAGVPLITVRDLLGHSSIQTTEIYAHLSPDNVRKALAVLE